MILQSLAYNMKPKSSIYNYKKDEIQSDRGERESGPLTTAQFAAPFNENDINVPQFVNGNLRLSNLKRPMNFETPPEKQNFQIMRHPNNKVVGLR